MAYKSTQKLCYCSAPIYAGEEAMNRFFMATAVLAMILLNATPLWAGYRWVFHLEVVNQSSSPVGVSVKKLEPIGTFTVRPGSTYNYKKNHNTMGERQDHYVVITPQGKQKSTCTAQVGIRLHGNGFTGWSLQCKNWPDAHRPNCKVTNARTSDGCKATVVYKDGK
jgi:hypothetical protein